MRDALDLINDDDRMFLKSVLYRWRKDKMIRLKVMHAEHEGERKAMGFIADTRVGEPEVYQCTSIGGLAVAALYEESLHVVGNADAMRTLLKAAQHLLPGGVE